MYVAVASGAVGSAVAGMVAVGVGGDVVLVAVGSTAASRACSCVPRAIAANSVKATSAAAMSPLHSGPRPRPVPPVPSYDARPLPTPKTITPQNLVVKQRRKQLLAARKMLSTGH